MQAIDIKAELHDDTLILPINILAERLSDASRAVGVKLLGYRAAPAAWHPRLVLLSVAADEGIESQTTRYRRDVEGNSFGLIDK